MQESVQWTPVKDASNKIYTAHPIIRAFLTNASSPIYYLKQPDGAFNKRGRSPKDRAAVFCGALAAAACRDSTSGRGRGKGRAAEGTGEASSGAGATADLQSVWARFMQVIRSDHNNGKIIRLEIIWFRFHFIYKANYRQRRMSKQWIGDLKPQAWESPQNFLMSTTFSWFSISNRRTGRTSSWRDSDFFCLLGFGIQSW